MQCKLVGFQLKHNLRSQPDSINDFYRTFFSRINEIRENNITRCARYESENEDSKLIFIGLEINENIKVPQEMVQWQFCNSSLTIKENDSTYKYKKSNRWEICSIAKEQSLIPGEFITSDEDNSHFTLTAHFYTDLKKSLSIVDQVSIIKYDSNWPEQFKIISEWLRRHLSLPPHTIIEHYGSTAIPNLAAKPVIDILMELPSHDYIPEIIKKLNDYEWEFWKYEDHMIFIKRTQLMGKRCLHLHIAPLDHSIWNGLLFRDYLRKHDKVAQEYSSLKCQLAERYQTDREEYTMAKTSFINDILKKAKSE